MWPLLAMVVVLIDAAASRTESLDFKNVKNSPPLRLNGVIRRPETDQPDKFDPMTGAGPFSEDLSALDAVKYQSDLEPFERSSILDELEGNSDETIPLVDDEEDTDIDQLSALLTQLLQEPGGWDAPLVIVEEPIPWGGSVIENTSDGSEALAVPWKRSRYYRRYPWKRQNSRSLITPLRRQFTLPLHTDARRRLPAACRTPRCTPRK